MLRFFSLSIALFVYYSHMGGVCVSSSLKPFYGIIGQSQMGNFAEQQSLEITTNEYLNCISFWILEIVGIKWSVCFCIYFFFVSNLSPFLFGNECHSILCELFSNFVFSISVQLNGRRTRTEQKLPCNKN